MDQDAFYQLVRYILMAIVVTGAFGLASGIIIWSIKGYLNLRTKIPRAACSYITMKDLIDHCDRQSGGLRDVMETKLDAAINALTQRLKAGDKIFTDHRVRLRELEQNLTVKIKDLNLLSIELKALLSEKGNRQSEQVSGP
ncbi:MAG: hypothetical protein U9R43_03080 [Thermodesulfobacteriota bacterium]|nr:hypothetical protein [Thermodesulfobacteriota bacterium]